VYYFLINVAHRAALVLQDQEVEVATNLGGENDQRRPEAEGTARSLRGPKNTGKEAIHRPLVVGPGLDQEMQRGIEGDPGQAPVAAALAQDQEDLVEGETGQGMGNANVSLCFDELILCVM